MPRYQNFTTLNYFVCSSEMHGCSVSLYPVFDLSQKNSGEQRKCEGWGEHCEQCVVWGRGFPLPSRLDGLEIVVKWQWAPSAESGLGAEHRPQTHAILAYFRVTGRKENGWKVS